MSIKKGDMLWVKLKGPASDYGYGEVVDIYNLAGSNLCFEFHCQINGGLRTGLEKDIIEKPTMRMMSKMASAQKELMEVLKKK